jgi:hypothetical protein
MPATSPPPNFLAAFVGAKHVLRRMAGAAMPGAFDQIAAAIPFRALLLIGHQMPGLKNSQFQPRMTTDN